MAGTKVLLRVSDEALVERARHGASATGSLGRADLSDGALLEGLRPGLDTLLQ